jgi:hypothetical protein
MGTVRRPAARPLPRACRSPAHLALGRSVHQTAQGRARPARPEGRTRAPSSTVSRHRAWAQHPWPRQTTSHSHPSPGVAWRRRHVGCVALPAAAIRPTARRSADQPRRPHCGAAADGAGREVLLSVGDGSGSGCDQDDRVVGCVRVALAVGESRHGERHADPGLERAGDAPVGTGAAAIDDRDCRGC